MPDRECGPISVDGIDILHPFQQGIKPGALRSPSHGKPQGSPPAKAVTDRGADRGTETGVVSQEFRRLVYPRGLGLGEMGKGGEGSKGGTQNPLWHFEKTR